MKNYSIKKGWAVTRLNFKSLTLVFVYMLAIFAVISVPQIIMNGAGMKVESLGFSTWLYTFAIVIPVLLATSNFNKTMRLGAKKKDYFVGVLIVLAILSAVLSFACIATYYAIDKPITDNLAHFYSLYNVFGFAANGIVVGFLQQFGFIFLLSILMFLFASIQDTWKGWVTGGGVVIFALTTLLVGVLRENIWQKGLLYVLVTGHPAAQICFTLVVGFALYFLYLLVLKRKKI